MRARLVAASAAAVLSLTGCGSFAEDYPPTGVDQLTIPTPSPDPADFVSAVDHDYLPLAPGSSHTYAVVDERSPGSGTRVVTVATEPVEVAGVRTTAVDDVLTLADGSTTRERRFYAEDVRGNVWLLGVEGPDHSWRAGEDGAAAGLAMAAEPRIGDGHRTGAAAGFDEVVEVVEVDDTDGMGRVTLERRDDGSQQVEEYAAGTGLIRTEDRAAGRSEELVAG